MISNYSPPQELPSHFIQMDEEGYFSSGGIRVTDEDYGRSLLESLIKHEGGSFLVNSHGNWAILEAFDEPLVVSFVEKSKSGTWDLHLPYGVKKEMDPRSLCLDEGDRFHGRTTEGLPFVLSRKAQGDFFNLAEDYTDDSITLAGQTYATPFWLHNEPQYDKESFWTDIYKNEPTPPWDLEKEATPLSLILPQLKIPRSRVLVLGAGRGHDAAYFAKQGHIVTAVDISPVAVEKAQSLYGNLAGLRFVQGDAFQLPENFTSSFDLIFEHTCYCAIAPERRNDLVKTWKKALAPGGHLLGVFFAMDKPIGPPYGGSEWEIRERLKKSFEFLYWTRWKHSIPRRQGKELVVYARMV